MAAWLVQKCGNGTLTELATRFGRDVTSMSSAVRRLEEKRQADRKVAEKLDQLRHEAEVAILQA